MPTTTCWITGNISDFRAYCKLYEYCDQLTVLDDVNIRKPAMVNLLRQLCNNDDVTTLTWDTDAAWLKENGIPNHFETQTRCASWSTTGPRLTPHVEALEDRGVIISFEPSQPKSTTRSAVKAGSLTARFISLLGTICI